LEGNPDFRFLVVSVELTENITCHEIIRKIATEFKIQLGAKEHLKEKAKAVWDFLTHWSVLGVEFKRDPGVGDPTEIMEDLASNMAKVINAAADRLDSTSQLDGILILIDEADKPTEAARLGEFVKLFTERLTKIGCEQVCLGLAGLPNLIPKLKASHESSPRVFDTLTLQPIDHNACKWVVTRGLEEANTRNTEKTTITDGALEFLARLSEGYPHFIQQFAYSAFDQDSDNNITAEDVEHGAFKTNGALDQLGKRYFDNMYYERVWSDDYRRVLHAMTENLDGWMSRQDIITKSGIKESQVSNALNALKGRNIIIASPQHKGEYRLPTKSFAVWIRGIEAKRVAAEAADQGTIQFGE
jgi:hypothetical protein